MEDFVNSRLVNLGSGRGWGVQIDTASGWVLVEEFNKYEDAQEFVHLNFNRSWVK